MFNIYLVLLGVVSSGLNLGILLFLNQMIQQKPIPYLGNYSGLAYLSLLGLTFFSNIYFQKKIIKTTNSKIFDNEILILKSIKNADLQQLESLGMEKVYATVEDLRITSSTLPTLLISAINSIGSIVVCVVYFFLISPASTAVVFSFIALILFCYVMVNRISVTKVRALRFLNEKYYRLIDDALKGFKEIKMSSVRRLNLFTNVLLHNRKTVRDSEIEVSNLYLISKSLGGYGLFFLLGIILFVIPLFGNTSYQETVSFVVILLFIGGPINFLISLQPFYEKAKVSGDRINNFISKLASIKAESVNPEGASFEGVPFKSLVFENLCFQYRSTDNKDVFELGPINLTIKAGEVVFIVGGNGSGKSTFINILAGLYYPTSGSIYLNDGLVNTKTQDYRDLMSVIFTDNYLFSQNYENYSLENNIQYQELVKRMELDSLFKGEYSERSARRPFSKGQGKRMSMIFSLLENRDILILDEWAADQDPHFRRYFYETMLEELRRENKTIVAVTHDDSYFKYADRVLEFNYGRIVKESCHQSHMLV